MEHSGHPDVEPQQQHQSPPYFGFLEGGQKPVFHQPTPSDVSYALAEEMTKLSTLDREKALNEVHGIVDDYTDAENPENLATALEAMKKHLNRIKFETAYEEAERMSKAYCTNQDFRLMFLRAERYDPRLASERTIRFFDLKKDLFGKSKLVKDITLDDFDEPAMQALRSGTYQLAPAKDTAGRLITWAFTKLRGNSAPEDLLRAEFYVYMSAITNDADVQRRGMVAIYYLLDGGEKNKSHSSKFRSSIPVHMAGHHLCYDDISNFSKVTNGVYSLSSRSRVRFRSHKGSHIECQYALTTFGIPRSAIPVSPDGVMGLEAHMQWLQQREQLEHQLKTLLKEPEDFSKPLAPQSAAGAGTADDMLSLPSLASTGVTEPNSVDILFGRGRALSSHPGNVQFRKLIELYANRFESSSRLEKTCITETILEIVKERGGRFLKRQDDETCWEIVSHETARKKVAHAFRNRRK